MTISATTQLCAVIGDPVEHSLSPQLHNAAFQAHGLNMVYTAFHVKRGDTRRAMDGLRALGIRGLSVTIPHKVDIIPHLDEVAEVALNIGSVNTVVNDEGYLRGYSTDGMGAVRALNAGCVDPAGKRILVIGSGGASRAIVFTLATLSPLPELTILGIDEPELRGLAADVAERTTLVPSASLLSGKSLVEAMGWAEIVIHTTPIGMTPKVDATVVPKELIEPRHVVFDVVYTPLQTRLLREARSVGATCVPGIGMFVHQAAIQFELWTGVEAPVDLMTDTVLSALGVSK